MLELIEWLPDRYNKATGETFLCAHVAIYDKDELRAEPVVVFSNGEYWMREDKAAELGIGDAKRMLDHLEVRDFRAAMPKGEDWGRETRLMREEGE